MRFDTENLPTKFFFDESDETAGFVELRVASQSALDSINEAATKKKSEVRPNPAAGKRLERIAYVETDEKLFMTMLWDYCITDWVGVEDASGKLIPCTAENKYLLMTNSKKFKDFISACLDKLNGIEAEEKEEAEKN